jgi:preprotein translocase subunit SecB
MTADRSVPQSGYQLLKVYTTELVSRTVNEPLETPTHEGTLSFAWDWRIGDSRSLFEVRLGVTVGATVDRPEHLSVRLVGRFSQVGDSPTVELEQFVQLHAVAILLPYVRQSLSNATANSYLGPYYLPTLAASGLMTRFDFAKSTGARQLADRPQIEVASRTEKRRATRPAKVRSGKRRLVTSS